MDEVFHFPYFSHQPATEMFEKLIDIIDKKSVHGSKPCQSVRILYEAVYYKNRVINLSRTELSLMLEFHLAVSFEAALLLLLKLSQFEPNKIKGSPYS